MLEEEHYSTQEVRNGSLICDSWMMMTVFPFLCKVRGLAVWLRLKTTYPGRRRLAEPMVKAGTVLSHPQPATADHYNSRQYILIAVNMINKYA